VSTSTSNGAPGAWESLWDARDVARYLKASRSWVYQQAEAGLLPSLRIGGLLRFNPEAVRAWAQGRPAQVIAMRRRPL
jgi:excisionase family DNA binding protein